MPHQDPPRARAVDPHAVIEPAPYRGSRLGQVLILVGVTVTALLIYVTELPWWSVVLVAYLPFTIAGVWLDIRVLRGRRRPPKNQRGA